MTEEQIGERRTDLAAAVSVLATEIRQVARADLQIVFVLIHCLHRNGTLDRNDIDLMARLLENRASQVEAPETAPDPTVLREFARMLLRDLPRRESPATDRNGV